MENSALFEIMKVSNNRTNSFMDMEKRDGIRDVCDEFVALRHYSEACVNIPNQRSEAQVRWLFVLIHTRNLYVSKI